MIMSIDPYYRGPEDEHFLTDEELEKIEEERSYHEEYLLKAQREEPEAYGLNNFHDSEDDD